MQPEAVNLKKAGRDVNKAFAEDSFRNYMARKIDMQRRQFGLLLPPPADPRQQFNPTKQQQTFDQQQQQLPPPPSSPQLEQQLYEPKKTIRFSLETEQEQQQHASSSIIKKRKSDKKFGIHSVLKRLKRRHGKSHKLEKQRKSDAKRDDESSSIDESCLHHGEANEEDGWQNKNKIGPLHSTRLETIAEEQSDKTTLHDTSLRQRDFRKQDRPDLFLSSVVVLVNGYTDPDTETLQRLLHKHGGDLEKYETSRVTHIIAEHLSTAKANMYKRQKRNPRPVCKPSWIVDSVQAKKLLPVCHYLIDEVRDDVTTGGSVMPSVAQYFSKGPGEPDVVIDRQQAQLPMAESTTTTTTDSIKDNSQQHARINNNNNDTMATYCSHWLDDEAPDLRQESADEEINEVSTITHAQSTVMGVNDCLESARIPAEDATAFTKDRTQSHCEDVTTDKSPADDRYINGRIRTVGTDPNFLESFFAASRLSFIGSYKQRTRQSPVKNSFHAGPLSLHSERFVFHVDMDCFFASVVIRNFPEYRDKPVAISHHGDKLGESDGKVGRDVPKDSSSECATCNYEARKFGIEKGMFLGRAKVLCPDLIVLPYDFEGYEVVSDAVSDILDRHAAENTGYVEHVSCDEAYVEFHIRSRDEKPPALVAAELAETIRLEVLDVTQCTASVGVASNKLLAKLATDHVKPNKSFVVMEDGRDLLKSLKLRELHGIGYRSERKLIDEDLVYVQDVWDLGGRGETELCRILGPGLGKKIHGFCQGKDDRPVQPAERKTIGAEVRLLLSKIEWLYYAHS